VLSWEWVEHLVVSSEHTPGVRADRPGPSSRPATQHSVDSSIGPGAIRRRPITDVLTAMLRHAPSDTLTGPRDRALLALGFAGAFRRSELVALRSRTSPSPRWPACADSPQQG
jgi:hypothetical protein